MQANTINKVSFDGDEDAESQPERFSCSQERKSEYYVPVAEDRLRN